MEVSGETMVHDYSEDELKDQRQEFGELLMDEPPLAAGQTWYLVATRWYNQWEEYVQMAGARQGGGPHPGPIDNSHIIELDGSLSSYMRERMDYVLRSEAIWKRLEELYGGGPPIPRGVLCGMWSKSVEIHPYKLKFLRSSDMDTIHTGLFSKGAKIKEVKNVMAERMGLNLDDVRMWDYHNDQKLKILSDPICTIQEERVLDGQKLLFEERLPDGKWPKLATKREREFDSRAAERVPPGVCGLSNLGNTCFMNSGLQCLSNTAPLAEFMVSGASEKEANKDNPLGSNGELLADFSELLQDMWSGRMSAVAPRDFKWKLERFAPQFSGWQQHDSHELLSFLLDGLHEDLNRVKKKPYFETNEFEGLPEVEAADKSWLQHVARNDSFIVDQFHGLLRSEVNCNVCTRVSKVFDPFMYLSVPLPEEKTRRIEVIVFTGDFSVRPIRYRVEAPKFGLVQDLLEQVAIVSNTDAKLLHICDVYSQRFFKHFRRTEQLSAIADRDTIFVIQGGVGPEEPELAPLKPAQGASGDVDVDEEAQNGELEELDTTTVRTVDICLLWKSDQVVKSMYSYSSSQRVSRDPPLIMGVPNKGTYKEYYDLLSERLARFFKEPATAEAKTDDSDPENNENVEQEPPKEKRLFRFALADRYGAVDSSSSNFTVPDDTQVTLVHGQNVVLLLDGDGCHKNVFDVEGAVIVDADESCKESGETKSGMDLSQCISLFAEREQLSKEDPWYCSECKEHREAYKKFDIWKMPKLLVIQLKRFSYRNKHWREKIETHVNFPLEGLDMTEHAKGPITVGEEPIYDLYAISNHYGALGGGHYTAFAKNANSRKWFKFDDSSVSEVHDPQQVITPAAYILFYRRRDAVLPKDFKMPTPAKYLAEEQEEALAAAKMAEEQAGESGISTSSASNSNNGITSSREGVEEDEAEDSSN